ncbi:lantibiotic dehydratase [Mucilaginibacter sp. P25]|uniref:lantibiotic dehydratase n=1 Tax=Mucilaginibacter sp. P25 TaxID=3423945 RepID=UPI003D7B68A2
MSFRGTPFGAFSTFGLTNWDNKVISRKNYSQTYTLHLLPSVQRELKDLQSKPLTDEIYIAINPTLYKLSLGWRYYRYEEDNKGKLSFPVYLLQYDPVDELLLNHLKDGSLSLDILIKYLVELTDCTRDEGANHIARLIDEQVLMSSNTLSLLTNRAAIKHQKLIFDNELRLFDKDAIIKLAKAENDNGKSFYAGLEMHNIAGLSVEWKQDILEALHMLDCIAPIPPKNNLDKFREAFEQKFGDRSVPLLEALDPDLGVAFDNDQQQDEHELLKGVVFKEEPKKMTN